MMVIKNVRLGVGSLENLLSQSQRYLKGDRYAFIEGKGVDSLGWNKTFFPRFKIYEPDRKLR